LRVERWVFAALLLGPTACRIDPEPLCKKGCAMAERCDLWMPEGSCFDYCVEHFEDSSDACQEKFEKAVNCFGDDMQCRWDGFFCGSEYQEADEACGWVDGSR
jgi:hypothetical protein